MNNVCLELEVQSQSLTWSLSLSNDQFSDHDLIHILSEKPNTTIV